MKILIDQNMSVLVAEELRLAGYDCIYTEEIGMQRTKDVELLEFAKIEGRVIVTKDKGDFTLTLAKTGAISPSVILVRKPLSHESDQRQAEVLLHVLKEHEQPLEIGAIISLHSQEKVRVSLLPIEGFGS